MSKWAMGWAGAVAGVLFLGGCATTGYQKAERSTISMNETRAEVLGAFNQVGATIKSLDTLMNAKVGDLRPLFKDFSTQLKALQSSAESARGRALSMQAKTQDYLRAWAQEMETIQDPTIKGKSLSQYKAAQARFQAIEQSLFKTRDAYGPLVSSLVDLEAALGPNLTPTGVATLRQPYLKARQQAVELQTVMKASTAAMDAAAKQLAPVAGGARM
jgi:hypothetical protein